MTAKSHLPKHVVRFYGNVDFALETVAHRQATLVNVSKLNDPFDPYFFFETDFEERYSVLLEYITKTRPNDRQRFIQLVPENKWNESVTNLHAYFNYCKRSSYILSASAPLDGFHPKDNLYLWGHYGNGHRGIAIEFDTEEVACALLAEHRHKTGKTLSAREVWIKVEYSGRETPLTRRQVSDFLMDKKDTPLKEYFGASLRKKANAWKSENEWRFIWRNDETRLKIHRIPIRVSAISAVYIGQNASKSSEEDMVFEVKHKFPKATIFKAKKRHGAFAIDFDPITRAVALLGLPPTTTPTSS